MSIHFTSAGAGTGKTHAVVQSIVQRVLAGLPPRQILATTFTKKAAAELEERIRLELHKAGRPDLAESLSGSLVGTVHSVCARILERHAFAAGLPPRLRVLEPRDVEPLLFRAIEQATESALLRELEQLGRRLGQLDRETQTPRWRLLVRQVVDACQSNDIKEGQLPGFARRSIEGLMGFLPVVSSEDLDQKLISAIEGALDGIHGKGDNTQVTEKYAKRLRAALEPLRAGMLPWSEWAALAKASPGAASRGEAEPVGVAAGRHDGHPQLRKDLGRFIDLIFEVSGRVLDGFRLLKQERAVLDFGDLEQRTLNLLRHDQAVRDAIKAEFALLVVDEFQDTSPIQLALFLEFARCIPESVWVGDVKQAIYGFRASDPELVATVVRGLPGIGGSIEPPLSISRRATPDLVRLANAVFVPAFKVALGLEPAQVILEPLPGRPSLSSPALEWINLSSGILTKAQRPGPKAPSRKDYSLALALALRAQWSGKRVLDRSGVERACRPGDVAVLCRTNKACAAVTGNLRALGVPVKLAAAGLLETPEAVFALACLRFLADGDDSLAAAETVALAGALKPEEWLEERLARVETIDQATAPERRRDLPFDHPILRALAAARTQLPRWSPVQALDAALGGADAHRVVTQWGPDVDRAAQRRANLEALRGLAAGYEASQGAEPGGGVHTVAGLLRFLEQLAKSSSDGVAIDPAAEGVFVGTYHQAKGLEWPVVVLADLDTEPRSRIWDATVRRDRTDVPIQLAQPLADRWIRLWVWPFGQQSSGLALETAIKASPDGLLAAKTSVEEELRLLYVGMTRARERLVLVYEDATPPAWLGVLNAPWLRSTDDLEYPPGPVGISTLSFCREILVFDGQPAPVAPAPVTHLDWYPEPEAAQERPLAWIQPSSIAESLGASVLSEKVYGPRLGVRGSPSEEILGNAIHAILAADWIHADAGNKSQMIKRILAGHELGQALDIAAVEAQLRAFREAIAALGPIHEIGVEVPFVHGIGGGQRVRGIVDLMLRTDAGWWIVDHKTFQGSQESWAEQAIGHSGQLATYAAALRSTGRSVAGLCIHFVVGGGWIVLGDSTKTL